MPVTKTSKEEILRATWGVFHEYGYHDASLQRLATAAGLGKAGLLHHFGSKRGLMSAVIEFAIDWYARRVLVLLEGEGTVEERLSAFMSAHFRFCQMNGGSGCFFANSILETGITGEFAEGLIQFHTAWKAAVEKLLTERFAPAEATERTYRLFAEYQGSVILFKLYQDASHLERFRVRALNALKLPIYSGLINTSDPRLKTKD
ncbi:TetR/AcrR family transcriptional regulator [Neolewinella antarctica]|uniref:TetR/AcrR family transcriptional repressor of nem operon n=1 Tax=Neolewinella antarctica TaxID=442734 RepID=A0ABX0XDG6_9BACT|nr:TetR/AcrR family transcriptional regulator [Neolewinella antarctica]NJC27353.1 TetR/AcrR family transcriptional repressor of nem operon [Neolewinella antarctica]